MSGRVLPVHHCPPRFCLLSCVPKVAALEAGLTDKLQGVRRELAFYAPVEVGYFFWGCVAWVLLLPAALLLPLAFVQSTLCPPPSPRMATFWLHCFDA